MRLWLALALALPPSAPKTADVCVPCHAAQATDFTTHRHFQMGLGCESCHKQSEKHRLSKGVIPSDHGVKPEEAPALCGGCHVRELKSYTISEHAKLLFARSEVRAPSCVTCHGAHRLMTASQTERRCVSCHSASFIGPSPPIKGKVSCMHCHSPHSSE
jgi:hypothetical protein